MLQDPTNGDDQSTDIEVPPDETLMLFDDEENSQFVVAYAVADQDCENIHGVETENVTGHPEVADELSPPNQEDARLQEMVESAPIQNISSSSIPLRAPRGRRRREMLAEREGAANNVANQLGQTLNALIKQMIAKTCKNHFNRLW
ncbi:hypothetical protein AB205_0103590 [Aquarana catesbeiana]|uniref:Uncharacterized protein n=1 Tax=Aquarana catesbeiana TaxID=8400 RepID=A0A2G9R4C9_AQUCT|nr:hypothetical protein AB205_0103590 [Aquarana catesbeiana]